MGDWKYTAGLHDLGNGCYAYLQPDGSWGWSNAGLITDGNASLLVDTLFDVPLTRKMLDTMADVTVAAPIKTLVNTHANGDHCWGNQLLSDREIIASRACRDEMVEFEPSVLKAFVEAEGLGALGEFARASFGAFDFDGICLTPPTRVFDGSLQIHVGGKRVVLVEVGPAHTLGDVLVFVPDDKTVFTGDILFIDGTPIMWAGPVDNWIDACDRIIAADVETIVPGHGPITDKHGVERVRSYLIHIQTEARKRFDAGTSAADAAKDISVGDFSGWGDGERIAVNVDTLYREFAGETGRPDTVTLFSQMAELSAGLKPAR